MLSGQEVRQQFLQVIRNGPDPIDNNRRHQLHLAVNDIQEAKDFTLIDAYQIAARLVTAYMLENNRVRTWGRCLLQDANQPYFEMLKMLFRQVDAAIAEDKLAPIEKIKAFEGILAHLYQQYESVLKEIILSANRSAGFGRLFNSSTLLRGHALLDFCSVQIEKLETSHAEVLRTYNASASPLLSGQKARLQEQLVTTLAQGLVKGALRSELEAQQERWQSNDGQPALNPSY